MSDRSVMGKQRLITESCLAETGQVRQVSYENRPVRGSKSCQFFNLQRIFSPSISPSTCITTFIVKYKYISFFAIEYEYNYPVGDIGGCKPNWDIWGIGHFS